MTVSTSAEPYPLTPPLHANRLIGSAQLLAWVLWRPPAWRGYISRIDPSLASDCRFGDLSRANWRHPLLRRLLWNYVIYVPLVLLVSLLALLLFERTDAVFAVGLIAPLLVSLILLVVGGATQSIAVGLALSVPGRLVFAIGYAIIGELGYPSHIHSRSMMLYALMLGLGGSIAGSVAEQTAAAASFQVLPRRQWNAWVSALIGGLAIGGAAVYATYSLLRFAVLAIGEEPVGVSPQSLPVASGVALLLVVLLLASVEWRRARSVLVVTGAMLGLTMLAFAALQWFGIFQVACVAFTCMFLALISIPYVMVEQLVGPRLAVLVSTLGLGGGFIAWMITAANTLPVLETLTLSLACLLGGLGFMWWGELLAHPLVDLWDLLLLRLDERGWSGRPQLRRHAAFWFPQHSLPFAKLEEHLVLVAERDPAEGSAAIERLGGGHQRWAAQAAQIELCARVLERCQTIDDIIAAHQAIGGGELDSPVSALLRSFYRIGQTTRAAMNNNTVYHKRLAFGLIDEQLCTLLNEMAITSGIYAPRFQPIAAQWRRIVQAQIAELAAAIEHSQEIDNPYIFSVPLNDQQDLFVGRVDIAARIEQLLLDRRRPPLLLYGQRRMGKTSLLRNLGRLLPGTIVLLFVDGEGIAGASNFGDFLYGVTQAMVRSAEHHRGLRLPRANYDMCQARPFGYFNDWLDEIESAMTAQGYSTALLALDEFESLDTISDQGRFEARDVLRTLRHLVQHRPRFKVLLAGSHTLEEFRHWATYLINMQIIKISYLQAEDTIALIERPIEHFPLCYEPAASQLIARLTRGHPHLVQLLCYEVVELKNRRAVDQRRLVTPADVEDAVALALQTGDFFFSDLANQVGNAGIELLYFLAGQPNGADRATLATALNAPLDATLDLLARRDIIELVDGRYRFQVELICRWFAQFDRVPVLEERAVA